jgi:two-component system, chemotaxis family, protein-glutamate methylesterase/glutaminase
MFSKPRVQPDIVAIGASAGGLDAIIEILRTLPANLPASVLVVLHRSPFAVSFLPEILGRNAQLEVRLAQEMEALEHGVCFVSPPDRHLTVTPALQFHLLPDGFYRGHSIDALFNSLARCAGPRTIGVVLSGMLKDGALGLKSIKEGGGVTLVQDPRGAAHPEMPKNAMKFDGPIDCVGSPRELAANVCRRVGCIPTSGVAPAHN